MAYKTNPGKTPAKRKNQLGGVLIQLSSQKPSEVWRGMDQVRRWLKEDPEDRDVYGLLLDAVQNNSGVRQQVRNLLVDMMQEGSKTAEQAILALPSSVQDFLMDADDAYYSAEYDRAIQLYRQALKLDPENARAKEHLDKAEINRITGKSDSGVPRVAEQYYRRARSYMAAREVVTAMNLLNAAVEAARAKGMEYPEAKAALNDMNNLLLADEFQQKAKDAIEKGRRNEAINLYTKALQLDPTNAIIRNEITIQQRLENPEVERYATKANSAIKTEQWGIALDLYNKLLILMHPNTYDLKKVLAGIDSLIRASVLLNSIFEQAGSITEKDRKDQLDKIGKLLEIAEEEQVLKKSKLLRKSRTRFNQLTGKSIGKELLSLLGLKTR